MKVMLLLLFVTGLFSCAPKPASTAASSTSAAGVQNTIPAAFHGYHPDGAYSYTITASAIENYDGGKYSVKKVESLGVLTGIGGDAEHQTKPGAQPAVPSLLRQFYG